MTGIIPPRALVMSGTILTLACGTATAQQVTGGRADAVPPSRGAVRIRVLESLPIDQVSLSGRLGERHQKTVPYLLYLHDERHPWRDVPETKGQTKPAGSVEPDTRIGRDFMLGPFLKRGARRTRDFEGEYAGKWMDAASLMTANTGERGLADKLDAFAAALRQTQEKDGYLGIDSPAMRGCEWDMWNQWYVLYGLLSHHEYRGNAESLAAAAKMGAYIRQAYSPPNARLKIFQGAWAGGCTVDVLDQLVRLYELTGNADCLGLPSHVAADFAAIRSMRERRVPFLTHAYVLNAYLGGLVRLNQAIGDSRELSWLGEIWGSLAGQHLYPTGSMGVHERLTDEPAADLDGGQLQETCATVEWLLYTHQLYEATGLSRYANAIEDTLYNALLAAQSPDGARWAYFTPLSATVGGKRLLSGPTMCCYWSGPRAIARMPLYAYHLDADGLRVELYEPGWGRFERGGVQVTVHQETDYPATGRVHLRVDASRPLEFALKLRVPDWAREIGLAVNGQPVPEQPTPGPFVEIRRLWKQHDRVDLVMDLAVALEAMPGGSVCIRRGPEVLSVDARDNPGVDLKAIALGGQGIAEVVALPAGLGGRRLYACTVQIRGTPATVRLTPYAEAGFEGSGYRTTFPRDKP